MIKIQNKVDCCGCNACGDVCAKGAITFKTDIEGFWYPEVDATKCTDCGLCEKVCPIINIKELKKNDFTEPKCYAAMHKNLEVRFDSTSGGLFSALAEKMYRDGGYVGGAIYDDDRRVKQFISNDKADIIKLRSSKYTQSNLEGFFRQVRDLLKAGEKVLVCGAPCQMAALRAFLRKPYDNLIILDFVCRGINSPKVGRKYRESLEEKHGSKVVWQKAKNKELGWRNLTAKYIFENGDIEFQTKDSNRFTHGYLRTGTFCRPSCYDCKFKGFPRIADITLADFWGIENVDKSMDDNIGTSLVLINSKKGEEYFSQIQQKIRSVELSYTDALKGNPALTSPLKGARVNREEFFRDLDSMTFDEVADKYFPVADGKSLKSKVKKIFRFFGSVRRQRFAPSAICRFLKYNFFTKNIHINIPKGGAFVTYSHCAVSIHKTAKIRLNGQFTLGYKKVRNSKLETRFIMEEGSTLICDSLFGFMYGSDVEILRGGTLHIKGAPFPIGGGSNIGCNLICGNRIEIGYNVMMGRNVTIRDNNGGHFLNMQGYKLSKPVIIGNHVWLCESCTIMPGVKIGDGAVIGAHAVVTTNIPPNCLAVGNPAKVVQTNIQWKY